MNSPNNSLLESLTQFADQQDRKHIIESRAERIIAGTEHLIQYISEHYDDEVAQDLTKRLLNAIRTQDVKKFQRGIRRVDELK